MNRSIEPPKRVLLVDSFVPQQLAAMADEPWIRREFCDLCTKCFHELNTGQAGLIELVAIQQSRDEIVWRA